MFFFYWKKQNKYKEYEKYLNKWQAPLIASRNKTQLDIETMLQEQYSKVSNSNPSACLHFPHGCSNNNVFTVNSIQQGEQQNLGFNPKTFCCLADLYLRKSNQCFCLFSSYHIFMFVVFNEVYSSCFALISVISVNNHRFLHSLLCFQPLIIMCILCDCRCGFYKMIDKQELI